MPNYSISVDNKLSLKISTAFDDYTEQQAKIAAAPPVLPPKPSHTELVRIAKQKGTVVANKMSREWERQVKIAEREHRKQQRRKQSISGFLAMLIEESLDRKAKK